MTEEAAQQGEVEKGPRLWDRVNEGSGAWPWITWVLGALLWVQLFALGLGFELQLDTPRPLALLAYLLPLGLLTAGVVARSQILLLTLYLSSSLPGLVMLPPDESAAMLAPGSFLRIGLSILLYLALASAGVAQRVQEEREFTKLHPTEYDGAAQAQIDEPGALRRFVYWRIGVLIVLFVLPLYAVFVDGDVNLAIAKHYGDNAMAARTFFALVHFFIWCVASYMMVLIPSMNIEYDRRRFDRTVMKSMAAERGPRIAMRCGAILAVSALSFGLLWWIGS